jgi:hypothetical protein
MTIHLRRFLFLSSASNTNRRRSSAAQNFIHPISRVVNRVFRNLITAQRSSFLAFAYGAVGQMETPTTSHSRRNKFQAGRVGAVGIHFPESITCTVDIATGFDFRLAHSSYAFRSAEPIPPSCSISTIPSDPKSIRMRNAFVITGISPPTLLRQAVRT